MQLIKNGRLAADAWRNLADDAPLPQMGPVIVGLARWRAEREALIARGGPLGIRLASDEPPSEIAEDVGVFDVIALEFPKFTDGRAYSYARLLRERHGFRGELRAVGNVLSDQFLFMHRCGFDAFEAESATADGWQRAMTEIAVWYQPTGDERAPVSVLRHRRTAAE
jgi:uncharacterized protein (DUF934 family)